MTVTVAGGTSIEWCDFTFNPWWGCERVSPGCAHCYADTLARRRAPGQELWGPGHSFRFFGDGHWAEPLRWARTAPAKLGRRPRVFCASMADVFEERPELDEHRLRLLRLIEATPELDWLLLTKRPEFARDWLAVSDTWSLARYQAGQRGLPGNVWMGVSIENARFTWRADALREIPAAVRFISAEPLLGSLFQDARDPNPAELTVEERRHIRAPLSLAGIDWVIVGGESGHGARPMHPEWARELRDAVLARYAACATCEAWPRPSVARDGRCDCVCGNYTPLVGGGPGGRPAFLVKQWGEWAPAPMRSGVLPGDVCMSADGQVYRAGRDYVCAPNESDGSWLRRVGKKAAGRELDGKVWDEFPVTGA